MATGNNGSRLVGNTEFYGGLSTDDKIGIENSYADGECLDVRKSPSQMTVLPMSRKLPDGNVITGLMTAMTQSKDGNIWGVDEAGDLYKLDTNNNVSKVSTLATGSGFGLSYIRTEDALWYTDGKHTLFSYGPILNPGGLTVQTYSNEYLDDKGTRVMYAIDPRDAGEGELTWYAFDTEKPRSGGNKTAIIGTSVSETDANKILFLPSLVNITKIGVGFTAKGSGTVRVEIHNEFNDVVAMSTAKAAADVVTSGYTWFDVRPNTGSALSASNQFRPNDPWSGDTAEAGSLYHIHIVASTSGYSVRSYTSNNTWLSGDISAQGTMLNETFNQKHPIWKNKSDLLIGNGEYITVKSSSAMSGLTTAYITQNGLRLDDGFEACCFGTSDEYIIIGAEQYNARSDRGFQAGRLYFWDGATEGHNFYIDCTMGAPKAILNYGNIVYLIIAGALYAYTGGKELVKVRTLKGTDTEYTGANSITEVNPNMMAVRRETMVMGYPSKTSAYSIRHGIYAFGSVDKNYPNCFTYNYKIPGETVADTLEQYNSDTQQLRIGCVYNFNDTLYYSYEVRTYDTQAETWTTDTALAVVDNESGTSTSFLWKSLQYDAGAPYLEKMALRIGVFFNPLPANTTITPIYRIDDGPWVAVEEAKAVAGNRVAHCEVNKRFHELQYGFIGTTDNDNLTPVIKQVSAEIRVLNEEQKL
jgi:hypothetical protein